MAKRSGQRLDRNAHSRRSGRLRSAAKQGVFQRNRMFRGDPFPLQEKERTPRRLTVRARPSGKIGFERALNPHARRHVEFPVRCESPGALDSPPGRSRNGRKVSGETPNARNPDVRTQRSKVSPEPEPLSSDLRSLTSSLDTPTSAHQIFLLFLAEA